MLGKHGRDETSKDVLVKRRKTDDGENRIMRTEENEDLVLTVQDAFSYLRTRTNLACLPIALLEIIFGFSGFACNDEDAKNMLNNERRQLAEELKVPNLKFNYSSSWGWKGYRTFSQLRHLVAIRNMFHKYSCKIDADPSLKWLAEGAIIISQRPVDTQYGKLQVSRSGLIIYPMPVEELALCLSEESMKSAQKSMDEMREQCTQTFLAEVSRSYHLWIDVFLLLSISVRHASGLYEWPLWALRTIRSWSHEDHHVLQELHQVENKYNPKKEQVFHFRFKETTNSTSGDLVMHSETLLQANQHTTLHHVVAFFVQSYTTTQRFAIARYIQWQLRLLESYGDLLKALTNREITLCNRMWGSRKCWWDIKDMQEMIDFVVELIHSLENFKNSIAWDARYSILVMPSSMRNKLYTHTLHVKGYCVYVSAKLSIDQFIQAISNDLALPSFILRTSPTMATSPPQYSDSDDEAQEDEVREDIKQLKAKEPPKPNEPTF